MIGPFHNMCPSEPLSEAILMIRLVEDVIEIAGMPTSEMALLLANPDGSCRRAMLMFRLRMAVKKEEAEREATRSKDG
jgi:hypothetical protein